MDLALSASARVRPTDASVAAEVPHSRSYVIGPVPVQFTTRVPGLLDDFHRYYQEYEVPIRPRGAFEVEIVATRSPRTFRRYFRVLLNGQEQCILRQRSSILPHVEWALNVAIARYLPGYYQIHAAVMSWRGDGAIMAGCPGQGKSTLAAGLLARGWSYLSDEFALIDPRSRLLMPYPKTLCIKAGSFDVLTRLGLPLELDRVLHKASKGPVSLLDPLAVRADAVSKPCPVRLIVFPEYQAGATPRIEPMSRARAVYELIQVSFNFTKFRGNGLSLLAETARRAQCVRLRTGDLAASCELLQSYMDNLDWQPSRELAT
jgi:HprK-related kinase A